MKRLILPLLISLLGLGLLITMVMLVVQNDAGRQPFLSDRFKYAATLTHTPAGDDELLVEVTNVSDRTLYVDDVYIYFRVEGGDEEERRRGDYPWILRTDSDTPSRVEPGSTKRHLALVPKDFDVFSMPHVVQGRVGVNIQGSLTERRGARSRFSVRPEVPLDVVSEPRVSFEVLLELLAGADRVVIEQYNRALPVNRMVIADSTAETQSFVELLSALRAEGGTFAGIPDADVYYLNFFHGDEWLDFITYSSDGRLFCSDHANGRQLRAVATPKIRELIEGALASSP